MSGMSTVRGMSFREKECEITTVVGKIPYELAYYRYKFG